MSSELTSDERQQVEHLLLEYQDIFLGPGGKLGHTDLVTHSIDTGSHPPIKQAPR